MTDPEISLQRTGTEMSRDAPGGFHDRRAHNGVMRRG
jgi:hypothetical protein